MSFKLLQVLNSHQASLTAHSTAIINTEAQYYFNFLEIFHHLNMNRTICTPKLFLIDLDLLLHVAHVSEPDKDISIILMS